MQKALYWLLTLTGVGGAGLRCMLSEGSTMKHWSNTFSSLLLQNDDEFRESERDSAWKNNNNNKKETQNQHA